VTTQLSSYKGLVPDLQDWTTVVRACQVLADGLLNAVEERT